MFGANCDLFCAFDYLNLRWEKKSIEFAKLGVCVCYRLRRQLVDFRIHYPVSFFYHVLVLSSNNDGAIDCNRLSGRSDRHGDVCE